MRRLSLAESFELPGGGAGNKAAAELDTTRLQDALCKGSELCYTAVSIGDMFRIFFNGSKSKCVDVVSLQCLAPEVTWLTAHFAPSGCDWDSDTAGRLKACMQIYKFSRVVALRSHIP